MTIPQCKLFTLCLGSLTNRYFTFFIQKNHCCVLSKHYCHFFQISEEDGTVATVHMCFLYLSTLHFVGDIKTTFVPLPVSEKQFLGQN